MTRRLLEHIPQFAAHYALRPDWDRASLAWFLRHAAQQGPPRRLFRRMVYGRKGAPIGCYLYYGRPSAASPGCCKSWRCPRRSTPSSPIC